MRNLLLVLLLASAASPAIAQLSDDDRDRPRIERPARAERSESATPESAHRAQRPERAARTEDRVELRDSRPPRAEAIVEARPERIERRGPPLRHPGTDRTVSETAEPFEERVFSTPVAPEPITRRGDTVRDGRDGRDGREQRDGRDGVRRGDRDRDGSGTDWGSRERTAPATTDSGARDTRSGRGDRRDGHRWSNDWRRDHRYDWRSHRSRYSSLFRLGRYYDPFGWGYRRFSIGFSLGRGYFGSRYWLNDPWQYRLPPAYGPYRWVRYYDDALLVDIYSGQVVDVIHGFFW